MGWKKESSNQIFVRLCELSPDFEWDTQDTKIASILRFASKHDIGNWRSGRSMKGETVVMIQNYLLERGLSSEDVVYCATGKRHPLALDANENG